jgi:hypothetical protein
LLDVDVLLGFVCDIRVYFGGKEGALEPMNGWKGRVGGRSDISQDLPFDLFAAYLPSFSRLCIRFRYKRAPFGWQCFCPCPTASFSKAMA